MKVVIAIDSFKGSLCTVQAGNAVADGIRRVFQDAEIAVCPIADGGEGTTNALTGADPSCLRRVRVHDPLGRIIDAEYGVLDGGRTAVMEMAAASGITLLTAEERNPMMTTTYGVGEMIRHAMASGCRKFLIGIGGSATNDGGVGMLQALGFSFTDEHGREVGFGADGVEQIRQIDLGGADPLLTECRFHIACDVKNILCGAEGCSAVFGPQKGATHENIFRMDQALAAYATLTATVTQKDHSGTPGVGAAGGLGFAFVSYLNATLESGIGLILRETGVEEKLRDADFAITGEGRLDEQTAMGKAPAGVAALAARYGVPVIAFSGCVTSGAVLCHDHGIHAFFPILRTPCTVEEAMEEETAIRNLRDTAEEVFRLIRVIRSES